MDRFPGLSEMTHAQKDALILALFERLDAAEARIRELERRLGLNSSNSGKPPSSDGYAKPPKPQNLREKTGKKSGGQGGHEGSNLRQVATPDAIIDHVPAACMACGAGLGLEQSLGHRARQVFDIPPPPPVRVTEHRAHCCQCGCGARTDAGFPQDVTAQAQYGANLAALVVYLQAWHFLPEDRLAELLRDVFGVDLSTATIAAMVSRKASLWQDLAAAIGARVATAAVKHLDETGLRIATALHWLHVASTWALTFYRISPRRGAMPEGFSGIVVHDFWRPYFTLRGIEHALCNAHHLRELKGLVEAGQDPWARAMSRFLRQACHAANLARRRSQRLKPTYLAWMLARYDRILAQGLAWHEAQPPLPRPAGARRGKPRRRAGHNLLLRLQAHRHDVLRFLENPDVPFSNNQAERDIRMMKLRQKISGCFRSQNGAQAFATLRTVLSTAKKQGWNILQAITENPQTLEQNLKAN